ncbi:MAG: toll/interleukin-1 receptor domain-containing protein, partial [Candidatus Angelobacter sp.]
DRHSIVFCSHSSIKKCSLCAIIVGTMDVFISWSGERSRAAAEALRGWLPKIINAIKPWLSSADIAQGARWSSDVAIRLESARAGIICLTPDNLHADWILFEAGALSKTLQNTFVCPFLIGLDPSDVKPPLAQFQATRAERDDVLKLLKTLNSALRENALPEPHIEEAFEVWWPKLDQQLKSLPTGSSKFKAHRSDRELLEELLALVRSQNRIPVTRDEPSYPNVIEREARYLITALTIERVTGHRIALRDEGFDCEFRTPSDKKYSFRVPLGLPLADMRALLELQLGQQIAGSVEATSSDTLDGKLEK